MSDSSEFCLYHRDKEEFIRFQKDLQKWGWISQKYIHRLAMAVCCCRQHVKENQYQHDRDRLLSVKSFLYDLLNKEPHVHNCSDQLKSYILNCLEKVNETDYSCCKMLDILYQAKHGDFSALNRERKESDTTVEAKGENGTKRKKMTKTQIECMLRKRKRRMDMHVIKLLMFPGNFPKLSSEDEVKDVMKKNNCLIETDNVRNNKSFADNSKLTYVKVWTNHGEHLETVRRCLATKASALQRELDLKRQRQKERFKEERRTYFEWKSYYDKHWHGDETVFIDRRKEIMVDDYELKSRKSKQRSQKPMTSPLDKGHCLHCQKEFTSLKDKTLCKYHSGYIIKREWSCCGESISNSRITKAPTYLDHQATGCVEAPTHVWRAHTKTDHKERKASASSVMQKDDRFGPNWK